jgi:hypothetical protein
MRKRIEQLISRLNHPKGRHRRTTTPPVSVPQERRRLPIGVNGDAVASMLLPYVVVAQARRNGAVSW